MAASHRTLLNAFPELETNRETVPNSFRVGRDGNGLVLRIPVGAQINLLKMDFDVTSVNILARRASEWVLALYLAVPEDPLAGASS